MPDTGRVSSLLAAAIVGLSALLSSGSTEAQGRSVDAEPWTGDFPIHEPWLREQLPAGALSYHRIPHPLGLLAIPKGNGLDAALGSEANIRNLINIQQGLNASLPAEVPPAQFLAALQSPVEIAILSVPGPSAMIAATLGLRSSAELEAFVAGIGSVVPGIALAAPLDDDGFGQIVGAPMPIQLHFDAATGRLALFGGLIADPASFAGLLDPSAAPAPHPMVALEDQVDQSGQGLFFWIDAPRALQFAALFDAEAVREMTAAGFDRVEALAFGAGVAGGKGRFRLIADVGDGPADLPLPVVSNRIAATAAGDPRSLFLLSVPGVDEFSRIESLLLEEASPEAAGNWAELKTAFATATGTAIEDILAAIGPELMMIADEAGNYFALRLADSGRFEDLLAAWSSVAGLEVESRTIGGTSIRAAVLPASFRLPVEPEADETGAAANVLGRLRRRAYWISDGDYLYLASTPQVLIDRIGEGGRSDLADWLDQVQQADFSSSLLAGTGVVRDLPRRLYHGYLGMMQGLADLVGVEYDIWSMPTASELGLPDQGAFGLAVNLGRPYLSIEASYESFPAEMLISDAGAAGLAGVLAAIAIPAYQDYTIRAQVSEGLAQAAGVRSAVQLQYLETGTVPADRAAAGLPDELPRFGATYLEGIDVADGQIVIRFGSSAHSQIAGQTLALTPYEAADGSVSWVCGYAEPDASLEAIGTSEPNTTIMPPYLPSACR